jgi:hypothetical protein
VLYTIVTETTADGLAVIVGDAIVTVKVRASFVRLEISNNSDHGNVISGAGGVQRSSTKKVGEHAFCFLANER